MRRRQTQRYNTTVGCTAQGRGQGLYAARKDHPPQRNTGVKNTRDTNHRLSRLCALWAPSRHSQSQQAPISGTQPRSLVESRGIAPTLPRIEFGQDRRYG